MRVAVVGAGMAGLGAATTLHKAGIATVVFESGSAPGGRVATHRVDGYAFDHGATVITPRGTELEQVILKELPTGELTEVLKPIYLADDDRVTSVDPESGRVHRYCYLNGIDTLARLLADGLDLRLDTPVEEIKKSGPHFVVEGESFSHVVLTMPFPLAEPLLASAGDKRTFPGAQYRKCLSVMFGLDEETDRPYHALLDPNQSQPMTWLSLEHVKVPGGYRAPAGKSALVVQMGARYSRYSFERVDEEIVRETWVDVKRLLKLSLALPELTAVKRWQFSHSSNTVSFESANHAGAKLILAGDGISGARTHQAFSCGVRAAQMILEDKQ